MSNTGKKDPAKEIGVYLLKGWTLLGESCPECNVPLVEDKKRNAGVMLCVNCNKQYVREKDVQEGKFQVAPSSTGSTDAQKPTSAAKDNAPIKEEKEIKKNTQPSHFTDDYYDDDDDWVPPTEEELKEIEAARKRNDEISAKLSQKLLQGWAMVDIVCPACFTPLMRNKQKQLFCVACDTLVVDQSEFDPKIHTAVNKEQLQDTPTAPVTSTNTSSSNNNATSQQVQQSQIQQQQTFANSVGRRDDIVMTRPESSYSEPSHESSFVSNKQPRYESSEDVHSKRTVDVAVKRLLTRLEDASVKLEMTEDLDKSKQLCSFIRECGSAIETMIAVQKALQK